MEDRFMVDYDRIRILGHQRSGNHYLAALISRNFLSSKTYSYLLPRSPHAPPKEIKPQTRYLIIERNFDDVIKSVFNLRFRLGLSVDSVEELLRSQYADVYDSDRFVVSETNIDDQPRRKKGVSRFFANIHATPEQWYAHLSGKLSKLAKLHPNVKLVQYENLRNHFQDTMLDIAQFLGSGRTEFQDVTERVGWLSATEIKTGVRKFPLSKDTILSVYARGRTRTLPT